jgi:N-acetyl-gamma-glutamyl-phosphate reductase
VLNAEAETATALGYEAAASGCVRVAVLGATGYAGGELIKLLAGHPAARIVRLGFSGREGKESVSVEDWHPALKGATDVPIRALSLDDLAESQVELAFLATPHAASHDLAPKLLKLGMRVLDLSGAFRLKDSAAYRKWYGFEHVAADTLQEAVYGLPELNAAEIREARLVANPGCYATSAILALAPLLQAGAVDVEAGIICDSKSGASGAGRSPAENLLFANVNENCRAYGLFTHRHVPEMLQALNVAEENFTFTPHLLPLTRGILSTLYLRVQRGVTAEEVAGIFGKVYGRAPFVRVYGDGKLPEIRSVACTPYADLGWKFEERTRRLVLVSALDNLGKGAASQAVQNMNLLLGCAEDAGLK